MPLAAAGWLPKQFAMTGPGAEILCNERNVRMAASRGRQTAAFVAIDQPDKLKKGVLR
jgi:hypothetical protein